MAMATTLLSLLLAFAIAIALPLSQAEISGPGLISAADQPEFDYLKLALYWSGSVCRGNKKCCSQNACCRSPPTDGFAIHGFWPDYNDGTYPSCCPGSSYDQSKIKSLLPALKQYWPAFSCEDRKFCGGKTGHFLAYEWEKHGTCAYPTMKGQYSYFATALQIFFKYDVSNILYKAGVVPTNAQTYRRKRIATAIESSTGASIELVCGDGYLTEVHMCFKKSLKPMDCPVTSGSSSSSCPEYVMLPQSETHISEVHNERAAFNWPEFIETSVPVSVA